MEQFLAVFKYFPQFDSGLSAGLMIFARFLAFSKFAPVLGRSEVNTTIRLAFSLIMTIIMFNVIHIEPMPADFPFMLGIFINVIAGAFIGWGASAIFAAIAAGGDMINMQMGLSSAMVLDPTTSSQTSIFTKIRSCPSADISVFSGVSLSLQGFPTVAISSRLTSFPSL